jgi:hypothetical protein
VRIATGDWQAPAFAAVLLLGILLIYAVMRPKAILPADNASP